MEHLIRIVNEADRQTLGWLRTHVGDTRVEAAARRLIAQCEASSGLGAKPYVSAVCRYLGVWPPISTPIDRYRRSRCSCGLASQSDPADARGAPRNESSCLGSPPAKFEEGVMFNAALLEHGDPEFDRVQLERHSTRCHRLAVHHWYARAASPATAAVVVALGADVALAP